MTFTPAAKPKNMNRIKKSGCVPNKVSNPYPIPKPINIPANYYPDDDPTQAPQNRWRSHAHLLYGNWVSEIYLTTPYDISRIGTDSTDLRK